MKPNAKKGVALGAGAAMLAAAFVAPWEGLFTRPYRDIVGVVTVCYGETENVEQRYYPPQECKDLLATKLPRYYAEISSCWGPEVEVTLTDNMRVAFVSGAYNFGSYAFCNSSMVRALKAGDRRAACHALRLYNRAGGRVVKGLDNRRKAEEKLCLEGL
jgi:lysozyme